jgi:Tol biopolymer transport system component
LETLLLKLHPEAFIQAIDSWSPDGHFITYTQRDRGGRSSVWALKIGGDPSPIPVPSNFNMRQGRISPDGRWLAYVSNESGRDEVYVQQFPPSEGRWQVSAHGGTNSRWSHDGSELFYARRTEL